MPFGPYRDFEHCVRSVSHKKNPPDDPEAYCAWLERKISGGDPTIKFIADKTENVESWLYSYYRLESLLEASGALELLTKEKAEEALQGKDVWKGDPDAVVLDDHRWCHMWENAIAQGHDVFLTKKQLKKLHDLIVDELGRHGLDSGRNHKSPIKTAVYRLGTHLEEFLDHRQPFLLDKEFINIVGSTVSGKDDPDDLDLMFKSTRNRRYMTKLRDLLPEKLRENLDYLWEPSGPNGPYIPAYQLWAVPYKNPRPKEPKYHIYPLSPITPATPRNHISDAHSLYQDSYYVAPIEGVRAMVHRRENRVLAFDEDCEEIDLPEEVEKDLLQLKDPRVFILDGYLNREDGEPVFRMLDLPWWRSSEHLRLTAEERRVFLDKIPETSHLKKLKLRYFPNRQDAAKYLDNKEGPYLLIPGMSGYPNNGEADWLLYSHTQEMKLAQSADEKIEELMDSGKWEKLSAKERFDLMDDRKKIEPLYPFAQLKTTKKGYTSREVFGMTSVKELADDLFKVPTKQAVEVKIDGFRVQAHRKGDEAKLFTESGHEITEQLPTLVKDLKQAPAKSFILDCECTPYNEDLTNMGRAKAAPAFAEGAKGAVDDKLWALHCFDILYIDGKDLHGEPYEARRKRLHGLEFPVQDYPDSKSDLKYHVWENHVHWATTKKKFIDLAEKVSDVPGSEGAMFKDADSEYRLDGDTPLWSKMKIHFEVDALVVGKKKTKGGNYNYIGAVGPVKTSKKAETAPLDTSKGKKFVKWKGKTYSILGKTFNTDIKAKVGDILRVVVKEMRKVDDKVYHWFHPKALEKREDKTKPDPLETAREIEESAKGKRQLESLNLVNGEIQIPGESKEAYLLAARYGHTAPLSGSEATWLGIPDTPEWVYLRNDEDAPRKLADLGVETVYGRAFTRENAETLQSAGIDFQVTQHQTVGDMLEKPLQLSEPYMPTKTTVNGSRMKQFLDSIRSPPGVYMKTTCCAAVKLRDQPMRLADPYIVYPEKKQRWSLQFHIRGLSVHGDFRFTVSEDSALGWTWDIGKSLLRPMLRRTSKSKLDEVGVTEKQVENMDLKDLSEKVRSTDAGEALMDSFTQEIQDLSMDKLEKMMDELWGRQMKKILEDPNDKILTQRKSELSPEWLDYEEEVPPGAAGATKELEGVLIIMDKGTIELGAQKSYYHEYFIKGKKIGDRRLLVRKIPTRKSWGTKESFAWLTFFSKKGERPYVISKRAVNKKWVPPKGKSALPSDIKKQIPRNRRYWKAENAREIRDQLVKDLGERKITLKLAGMQFAVKRVWHKGPEIKRGLPDTRYWLLIHDGSKVHEAFNFGASNPLETTGLIARRRKPQEMKALLKDAGELKPGHPASQVKSITTEFDTSDKGAAKVVEDENGRLKIQLKGDELEGVYAFVRESSHSNTWIFQKAQLTKKAEALLLSAGSPVIRCGTDQLEVLEEKENILLIRGPAIKPGEVLPMDGKPAYFTKTGISDFWSSMNRQPIVVLHGELKGDVIGFVNKAWRDDNGWGWVEGVVWHPVGMQLILNKTLGAFSIEVIPETVWDPEHNHEHVLGGRCIGLAVVPKGACPTCNPVDARMGTIKDIDGKIYKFGMTIDEYLEHQYYGLNNSTQQIADTMDIPRSTVENWMDRYDIPRRGLVEARHLRMLKEREVKELGGRAKILALGTGAFTDIPRDKCPQCEEAREGGKSKRNYTTTMFSIGSENLLINAPKGVATMLGAKKTKPDYVLLEHIHEDVVNGLHELRSLNPVVFATEEIWSWLRKHYRKASGEKGSFEDIYSFERKILPTGKKVKAGPFQIKAVKVKHASKGQPPALGFKVSMAGKKVWHCSDVYSIPDRKEVLGGVDIYIGDGAQLSRDIGDSHASMEKQIGWLKDLDVSQIFFTQIGHVGKTHKDLNKALHDLAPNAQALYDGAEITLGGDNPVALLPTRIAEGLMDGTVDCVLRLKPYREYAMQAIWFGDTEGQIYGLYVEGLPEKMSFEDVRSLSHGLTEEQLEAYEGGTVWVYSPKILRSYGSNESKVLNLDEQIGPYIHNVKLGTVD